MNGTIEEQNREWINTEIEKGKRIYGDDFGELILELANENGWNYNDTMRALKEKVDAERVGVVAEKDKRRSLRQSGTLEEREEDDKER